MQASFLQTILALSAGIVSIILLTVRLKFHPFFALLIACFITGLIVGLPVETILSLAQRGLGDILSKLTLIIVLGTAIGVLLEKNGSTTIMANFILRMVGEKRSPLALSITGFIVGLPIFCDSGYIVLNGINRSLARRAGIAIAVTSVSLGSGLYAVHCLLPPHPGATAAAATIGADVGRLILYGILIAIPAMLAGYAWARYAGGTKENEEVVEETDRTIPTGRVLPAFLPVLVPVLLMATRSLVAMEMKADGWAYEAIMLLGEPAVALAVGLVLAIFSGGKKTSNLGGLLSTAVEKAGGILIIIGAGGAFGAVLAATHIGEHLTEKLDMAAIGIWFPFLLTCVIKTAQGSSTVAIVTASSMVAPLLPSLGLASPEGQILAVLSMGAGSMMISHVNDAYFWVISRFSDIDIRTMLRVHSVASVWMGLVTMGVVWVLSIILL